METKRSLKVILLGEEKTGKSCLFRSLTEMSPEFTLEYKPTIGVDFTAIARGLESEGVKYKLELWDLGGKERFAQITHPYIRNADVVLITLDAEQQDQWATQIPKCKSLVKTYSPGAKILYVVNKWDYGLITLASNEKEEQFHEESEVKGFYVHFKNGLQAQNLEEQKKNIEAATQKKCDECRRKIEKIHQEKEAKVLFYSTQSVASKFRVIRENAITMKIALFEALDAVAAEKIEALQSNDKVSTKQQLQIINNEDPSYFTWSGFFKTALLFTVLSLVFLSLGGVTGGVEHIWPNIDGLFEAIQLGTDWGIGVAVASLGLALVITSAAVAWDYYCSHRDGKPGETGSEFQDGARGYPRQELSAHRTESQRNFGHSAGKSKLHNEVGQEETQNTPQPLQ